MQINHGASPEGRCASLAEVEHEGNATFVRDADQLSDNDARLDFLPGLRGSRLGWSRLHQGAQEIGTALFLQPWRCFRFDDIPSAHLSSYTDTLYCSIDLAGKYYESCHSGLDPESSPEPANTLFRTPLDTVFAGMTFIPFVAGFITA
jgi:hypothetical protein